MITHSNQWDTYMSRETHYKQVMCIKPDHINYSERNVLIVVVEKESLHEIKGHRMVFLLILEQNTLSLEIYFQMGACYTEENNHY